MIVENKFYSTKGKLESCTYGAYRIQRDGDSARPFKILDRNRKPLTDRRGAVRKFRSVTTAIPAIEREY